jgi:hypothetical protein
LHAIGPFGLLGCDTISRKLPQVPITPKKGESFAENPLFARDLKELEAILKVWISIVDQHQSVRRTRGSAELEIPATLSSRMVMVVLERVRRATVEWTQLRGTQSVGAWAKRLAIYVINEVMWVQTAMVTINAHPYAHSYFHTWVERLCNCPGFEHLDRSQVVLDLASSPPRGMYPLSASDEELHYLFIRHLRWVATSATRKLIHQIIAQLENIPEIKAKYPFEDSNTGKEYTMDLVPADYIDPLRKLLDLFDDETEQAMYVSQMYFQLGNTRFAMPDMSAASYMPATPISLDSASSRQRSLPPFLGAVNPAETVLSCPAKHPTCEPDIFSRFLGGQPLTFEE